MYPSVEEINALPEKFRQYIHDLVARCDKSRDVQTIAILRGSRCFAGAAIHPSLRDGRIASLCGKLGDFVAQQINDARELVVAEAPLHWYVAKHVGKIEVPSCLGTGGVTPDTRGLDIWAPPPERRT
jgi:hypothetical protein